MFIKAVWFAVRGIDGIQEESTMSPSERTRKMLGIVEMLQNLKSAYEPTPADKDVGRRNEQQKLVAVRANRDAAQDLPPDLMSRVYSRVGRL